MNYTVSTSTQRYRFSSSPGAAPPGCEHFSSVCQAHEFLKKILDSAGAGAVLRRLHADLTGCANAGRPAMMDALAEALVRRKLVVHVNGLGPMVAQQQSGPESAVDDFWSNGARPLENNTPADGFRPKICCDPYAQKEKHFIDLHYTYDDGEPVAGAAYSIGFADGSKQNGRLDADGVAHFLVPQSKAGRVQVDYEDQAKVAHELVQARTELKSTLDAMVAEVAAQSRTLSQALDEEHLLSRGVILTGAFLYGLYNAGKGMVKGACDMMVAANNAYEDAKKEIYQAIASASLAQVREKIGALAAKGERVLGELQQCYESLDLILGDAQCRQMLCDFPERYFANLHITEKAQMLGGLSLDIVLALLSGAAGAAASALSKSRHFAKAARLVRTISALLRKSKVAKKVPGRTDTKVSAQTEKIRHEKVKAHPKALAGDAVADRAKRHSAVNPDKNLADSSKGEPVNCVTGEVLIAQTDFYLPGRIPLTWSRRYGSQDSYLGLCGTGWQTPADARLEPHQDGSVTFFDGCGNASVFAHPPDGAPVLAVADGAVLGAAKEVLQVRQKSGLTYHFTSSLPLTVRRAVRISDAGGNWIAFGRDISGLAGIAFSDGRRIEVQSKRGRIEQMTLDDRTLIAYQYDDQGDLSAAVDALGQAYRFTCENQRIVSHTDRAGLSFYYTYDAQNRCTRTCGDNGLYAYGFAYADLFTVVTSALGGTQVYEYDDCNLPVRVTEAGGNRTVYEYDAVGRPAAVIDPLGRRTEYIHDRFGNLVTVIRPDGQAITTEYDALHNPIVRTDARGHIHRLQWDGNGRLTARISPTGAVTGYAYNAQGDLSRVTDALGHSTAFEVNERGLISAVTDPLGRTQRYRYDALGNLQEIIDSVGRATHCRYDAKGRLTHVQKPSGALIACAYDAADRLIAYTDEAGRTTAFSYCGIDRISRRTQPDGHTVHYHYNKEEQLVGLTDQKKRTFAIARDRSGRIVAETDYWGGRRRYAYDAAGQLVQSTDARGKRTDYIYDALGRLIRKTFGPEHAESFAYDADGHLIDFANRDTRVRRIFDKEGRLIKEIQGDQRIVCAYDVLGRRIRRRSPHGNRIAYRYDAAGQVEKININGAVVAIERDELGRPIAEQLTHHIRRTYDYDADDRLSVQHIDLAERSGIERHYSYDPAGNLTCRLDKLKGADRFNYDPMSRIVGHLNPEERLQQYLYDPAGDLHAEEERSGGLHRYRSLRTDHQHYTFDVQGQRIERRNGHNEPVACDWDRAGRLSAVGRRFGIQTRMAYDALGRRIEKKTLGLCTRFIWDGDVLLSDQRNSHGPREFVFYPGSFVPLAAIDAAGRILYYHNDHIGMPQEVSDGTGKIVWSARYDALGRVDQLFETQFDNPLRLQGAYEDETGLYYMRHRYYSPRTGQFISQDPLGLAAGENLYAIAPNVYGWVDPLGLSCKKDGPKTANDYLRIVDKLNIKTKRNEAVFYSGRGNRGLAENFAALNNKTTLEMTPAGQWLDQQKLFSPDSPLTPNEAVQVWSKLSQKYAEEASGTAVGFVQGARPQSIFNTVEYPALQNNPNIVNVITGGS